MGCFHWLTDRLTDYVHQRLMWISLMEQLMQRYVQNISIWIRSVINVIYRIEEFIITKEEYWAQLHRLSFRSKQLLGPSTWVSLFWLYGLEKGNYQNSVDYCIIIAYIHFGDRSLENNFMQFCLLSTPQTCIHTFDYKTNKQTNKQPNKQTNKQSKTKQNKTKKNLKNRGLPIEIDFVRWCLGDICFTSWIR